MNWLELVRGTGNILFIVALAGAIAYIGDRVGHQVGRKRLTLFNIRPRYTSTIIAVAFGMLIALVVTLGAIFASTQVKLAFFKLNEINAEIQTAQSRERALQAKVNNGTVIVNTLTLMSNAYARIPRGASPALRQQIVSEFYRQTVAFVNRIYTRGDLLKPFKPPAHVGTELSALVNDPRMGAQLSQSDVLLFATADQNLYRGDEIHFGITSTPDVLVYHRGDLIASETVPSGSNVSAVLAINEMLRNFIPQNAANAHFPPFLATNIRLVQLLPSPERMQTMLTTGQGTFVMAAFAATDIYPHTLQLPVVIAMQKAP